jgi:CheY-like chemotaxis protein
MDRDTLADIAHALRDLDGFVGVADSGERAVVIVSDPNVGPRAAARLTALPPALIDIRFDPTRMPTPIVLSSAELAAAARRDEARRAIWATRGIEIGTTERHGNFALAILVVSSSASEHAALLRSNAGAVLSTYATSSIETATDVIAAGAAPNVVLLDRDLPGAVELEKHLRTKPRFFWTGGVQWLSTRGGFRTADALSVLHTLRIAPAHVVEREVAKLRIVVVDTEDASLVHEVRSAAPGASVARATGWEALERLDDGDVDVVVAGEIRDVSLPTLVRFVARCKTPPLLVLASYELRITALRRSHPALARYFIARPVCTDDLFRVLRR